MTSWLSIMEKTNTLPNEMIHITLKCAMHPHGYRNKVVPIMKPSILANFNNDTKFQSRTYWSINDICSHHLPCRVNNHHIDNKNLILMIHVEIGL
jgi:hypothetical protein